VLRGPQGTLYGSNSQAGVIRIVTKKPKLDRAEGDAQTDLSFTKDGGFNYTIKGAINVPVVTDKFAVRLVGYYDKYDGFIDNPVRNRDNYNDLENKGVRIAAKLQIDDKTTLLGQVFYQKLYSGARPYERPFATTIQGKFYPADGERRISLAVNEPRDDETKIYALTGEHDFGWADLTVSTSYFDRDLRDIQDYTTSYNFFRSLQAIGAFPPFKVPQLGVQVAPQQAKLWANEARLSTKFDGPVNAVGGVFYSWRKIHYDTDAMAANPVTGEPDLSLGNVSARKFDDKTKDFALFGEVTGKVTDRLTVTGGARWFRTERDLKSETVFPFFGQGTAGPDAPQHAVNYGTIWKGLVSYKLTPEVLLYAQYAEGFRSGGTNASTVAVVPPQYNPDRTSNYELGAKTQWLNGALTVNLAAYSVDLMDLQVNQRFGAGGAFSGIGNVKGTTARSQGGELDVVIRPIRNLEINFNTSYTQAKLVKDVPDLGATAKKDAPLLNVPRFNYALGADYFFPLASSYNASIGGSLQHVGRASKTRYDEFDKPVEGYSLVNVRAGLEWGNYEATLYVNNLFDENAQLQVLNDVNDAYNVLTNRPRTVGVRFKMHW
jgi:iron complex outermembrane recepter protein